MCASVAGKRRAEWQVNVFFFSTGVANALLVVSAQVSWVLLHRAVAIVGGP